MTNSGGHDGQHDLSSSENVVEVEQSESYQELIRAISRGRCVILVGAGASKSLGYPLWSELLAHIIEKAKAEAPSKSDALSILDNCSPDNYLQFAQILEDEMGRKFVNDHINEQYALKAPAYSELHKIIAKIPFEHYLTTNYDEVIENAVANVYKQDPGKQINFLNDEQRSDFIKITTEKNAQKHIVHLHGIVNNPEGFILTEKDYSKYYVGELKFIEKLKIIYSTYRWLFVGFSFSDLDLIGPFRFIKECVTNGKRNNFAILQSGSESENNLLRRKMQDRYGIDSIFYSPENNHQELTTLLNSIKDDVWTDKHNYLSEKLSKYTLDRQATRPSGEQITKGIDSLSVLFDCGFEGAVVDKISVIDKRIDNAFEHVKNGKPDKALAIYEEMLNEDQVKSVAKIKYRVLANIGNAYYAKSDYINAAEAWEQANTVYPDTKESKAHLILSLMFKGKLQEAHSLCCDLCNDYPDFHKAHSLRIKTLEGKLDFHEVLNTLPNESLSDPEVASAVCLIAKECKLVSEEEKYSRIAWEKSPTWSEAGINLSCCLISNNENKFRFSFDGRVVATNKERVIEAESILTTVIDSNAIPEENKNLANAYFNRATARFLLNHISKASEDIKEAYRLNSSDILITNAYVMDLYRNGNTPGAIEVLENFLKKTPNADSAFYLALILFESGQRHNLERSKEVLLPYKNNPQSVQKEVFVHDYLNLLVRILIELQEFSFAKQIVDEQDTLIENECLFNLYKAKILYMESPESKQDALVFAGKSLEICNKDDNYFDTREVADFYEKIGEFPVSAELWKRIACENIFNIDTLRYLTCCQKYGNYKDLFDYIEKLKNNSVYNKRLLEFEIDALVTNREYRKAAAVLQKWLQNHDDNDVKVNLYVLTLRYKLPIKLDNDLSFLPTVDNVKDAFHGLNIIYILSSMNKDEDAANYSYDLYRRFPDDILANNNLVSLIFLGNHNYTPKEFENVTKNCAVTLKNLKTDEVLNVYLETRTSPSTLRREYGCDSEVFKILDGLQKGDTCRIFNAEHQVIAINDIILVRAKQCMDESKFNFPDKNPFTQIQLPEHQEGATTKENLGDVWDILKEDSERRQRLEGFYIDGTAPVSMLSIRLGKTVFETMCSLVSNTDLPVKVCNGSPEEIELCSKFLSQKHEVILDNTAIASLYILGAESIIKKLPYTFVITESSLDELYSVLEFHNGRNTFAGCIGMKDDIPIFQQYSEDEIVDFCNKLSDFIKFLIDNMKVVGGEKSTHLDIDVHDVLKESLGESSLDSIAYAKITNCTLWTDDNTLAETCLYSWNVKRTWTHFILSKHSLDSDDAYIFYREKVIKMFLLGYEYTSMNVDTMKEIFVESDWKSNDWKVQKLFEYIKNASSISETNRRLISKLIVILWIHSPKEETAKKIIQELLQSQESNVISTALARPIYRSPLKAFKKKSIAYSKLRRLKNFLRKWKQSN